MKLDNPFPQRVRLLYLYVYSCFGCGRSDRGLELHHIFGRDYAAAFNACPLCKICHEKIAHNHDEHALYFFINVKFLLNEHYTPQNDDYEMVRKEEWLTRRPEWKSIFAGEKSHS